MLSLTRHVPTHQCDTCLRPYTSRKGAATCERCVEMYYWDARDSSCHLCQETKNGGGPVCAHPAKAEAGCTLENLVSGICVAGAAHY